jgi:hypothetical protein
LRTKSAFRRRQDHRLPYDQKAPIQTSVQRDEVGRTGGPLALLSSGLPAFLSGWRSKFLKRQ